MKLVVDIEADAVNATKIWMIVAQDIDTDIMYCFSDYDNSCFSLNEGVAFLEKAEVIIGHNMHGYDLPVIERLTSFKLGAHQKVYDTWVMSQTLRYKRTHRQGLGGWGEHLGHAKIDFDPEKFARGDDPEVHEEMLRYCKQDVRLNVQVYRELMKEFQKLYSVNPLIREGLKIEHDAARFNALVRERGWKFDVEKAHETRKRFANRLQEIEASIEPQLGTHEVLVDKEPKTPKFKKNGNYNIHTVRHLSEYFGRTISEDETHLVPAGQTFQRTKTEQIKLGQIDLVKEWLLKEQGWKPDDWTVKKIDGSWVKQSP